MQVAMIHARSGFPTTSQRLCKWDARSKVKQMISTNSTSFVTIIALRHWLTRKCVNLVFTYWCDLMTTYIHLPQSYARNKILMFIDCSFYIKSSRNISSVKKPTCWKIFRRIPASDAWTWNKNKLLFSISIEILDKWRKLELISLPI